MASIANRLFSAKGLIKPYWYKSKNKHLYVRIVALVGATCKVLSAGTAECTFIKGTKNTHLCFPTQLVSYGLDHASFSK